MSLIGYKCTETSDLQKVLEGHKLSDIGTIVSVQEDVSLHDMEFLWGPVRKLMDYHVLRFMKGIRSDDPKIISYYWDKMIQGIPKYLDFMVYMTSTDSFLHDIVETICFKETWKRLIKKNIISPELAKSVFAGYIIEKKFNKQVITDYFGGLVEIDLCTKVDNTLNITYKDHTCTTIKTTRFRQSDIKFVKFVGDVLKLHGFV